MASPGFGPLDLNDQMVTAHTAHGQVGIAHAEEIPLQGRQDGRLARNGAEQQVLQSTADDGVENRVLAMGDFRDLDDVALRLLAVILREFAERPFHRALMGDDFTFDHDFRVGGNDDIAL